MTDRECRVKHRWKPTGDGTGILWKTRTRWNATRCVGFQGANNALKLETLERHGTFPALALLCGNTAILWTFDALASKKNSHSSLRNLISKRCQVLRRSFVLKRMYMCDIKKRNYPLCEKFQSDFLTFRVFKELNDWNVEMFLIEYLYFCRIKCLCSEFVHTSGILKEVSEFDREIYLTTTSFALLYIE